MADFNDRYGFFDKLLHRFAFASVQMQLGLAESEYEQQQQQLSALKIEKPVFITALPRAGTTILLDVLSKTQCFSYHSYQDMPFIFTPLMWRKFSRAYGKSSPLTERAHHDGIKINQQSPEAFEEMFYKAYLPEHYQGFSLPVNSMDKDNGLGVFFTQHIQKLLWRDGSHKRYLSKNNLNISRLQYIKSLYADAHILLPFRHPLQHALSLWRQHQNFTQLHRRNKFAKEYMAAVGHYDFGENLKPVNFNQWFERTSYQPDELNFWLEYWFNCYQYILQHLPTDCTFICFESLTTAPQANFAALAKILGIDSSTLLALADRIKAVKTQAVDLSGVDSKLGVDCQSLYQELLTNALVGL